MQPEREHKHIFRSNLKTESNPEDNVRIAMNTYRNSKIEKANQSSKTDKSRSVFKTDDYERIQNYPVYYHRNDADVPGKSEAHMKGSKKHRKGKKKREEDEDEYESPDYANRRCQTCSSFNNFYPYGQGMYYGNYEDYAQNYYYAPQNYFGQYMQYNCPACCNCEGNIKYLKPKLCLKPIYGRPIGKKIIITKTEAAKEGENLEQADVCIQQSTEEVQTENLNQAAVNQDAQMDQVNQEVQMDQVNQEVQMDQANQDVQIAQEAEIQEEQVNQGEEICKEVQLEPEGFVNQQAFQSAAENTNILESNDSMRGNQVRVKYYKPSPEKEKNKYINEEIAADEIEEEDIPKGPVVKYQGEKVLERKEYPLLEKDGVQVEEDQKNGQNDDKPFLSLEQDNDNFWQSVEPGPVRNSIIRKSIQKNYQIIECTEPNFTKIEKIKEEKPEMPQGANHAYYECSNCKRLSRLFASRFHNTKVDVNSPITVLQRSKSSYKGVDSTDSNNVFHSSQLTKKKKYAVKPYESAKVSNVSEIISYSGTPYKKISSSQVKKTISSKNTQRGNNYIYESSNYQINEINSNKSDKKSKNYLKFKEAQAVLKLQNSEIMSNEKKRGIYKVLKKQGYKSTKTTPNTKATSFRPMANTSNVYVSNVTNVTESYGPSTGNVIRTKARYARKVRQYN